MNQEEDLRSEAPEQEVEQEVAREPPLPVLPYRLSAGVLIGEVIDDWNSQEQHKNPNRGRLQQVFRDRSG